MLTLDEAALRLANKNIIYVFDSGGRPSASDAVRLLATQSAISGRNVVICDNTGKSEKDIKNNSKADSSDLPVVSVGNR